MVEVLSAITHQEAEGHYTLQDERELEEGTKILPAAQP